MWQEFTKFIARGNVIDLAVGIIIGAAFGKIIESLVKHIIMPLVSLVLPVDQGYVHWKLVVGDKEVPYGLFLGELVNFLIVAAALFFSAVKFLGWLMRSKKADESQPPTPTKEQELLTEIRDLLKQRAG